MRGEPLTPLGTGDCDECGGNVGPFVKFGGGTMSSEDCVICRKCIAAAFASMGGGWIPVEERWPKHGSDVLVAYKCGKYVRLGVGEFDGTTVNDEGVTIPYFKGISGFEVTHWMPLPEPPEVK